MHLKTRNVNTAFTELVNIFNQNPDYVPYLCSPVPIVKRPSRNGNVLMIDGPVTITYSHPKERVLFNSARDANPFFHLYEALWMLDGRNDVDSVAYYAKQMREYSDDGKTLNGAYGYRWRKTRVTHCWKGVGDPIQEEVDQLQILINHLKADSNSRRAVLSMWNVEDDLLKIGTVNRNPMTMSTAALESEAIEEWTGSKDVCCLAGETKFRSPEGDTSIAALAMRFQTSNSYKFPVYTVDTVTGDQNLSWMTSAWKTGVRPTIRIKLDDGSVIRLTRDHIVFKKKKLFEDKKCVGISIIECQAGDLKAGDSLLSEMPKNATARTTTGGYRVYKKNVFRNTCWSNLSREHRDYYEFMTGEKTGEYDIHHKNEIPSDNRIINLQRLNVQQHQRHHKKGSKNPHSKMGNEDKKRRGLIHSAVMQSGGKKNTPVKIRKILSKRPPYRSEEDNNVLWDWVCSISNHKVLAIEEGGSVPVYDFTVPGRHNAVLENGVLVHNCNLNVMFSIRQCRRSVQGVGVPDAIDRYLDMTITNRSNDMIWGLLGANYVHFSFLQEYIAAHLGVEVGRYHHFTNNLHVYDWNWKPKEWLEDKQQDWYGKGGIRDNGPTTNIFHLVKDPKAFDQQLSRIVDHFDGSEIGTSSISSREITEPFLWDVARPMLLAFSRYKQKRMDAALEAVNQIQADDWRIACTSWLQRRDKRSTFEKERELHHGNEEGMS